MSRILTLRLDERVYKKLKEAAEADQRPLSTLIETAALDAIREKQLVDDAELAEFRTGELLFERLRDDMIDDRYTNHRVFSELERYMEFYESLSFSVFGFISSGITAIFDFNSRFYTSMEGTLESIRNTLKAGRINDAYALLRKYHDSAVINIYTNLYVQDRVSIENLSVESINNWVRGKKPLPKYRAMSNYIRSSGRVEPITCLLYADERYKLIRERCNSHMHYNRFANALLNEKDFHLEDRLEALDAICSDVVNLFILHITYTFFMNERYMASSDYVDALECGLNPEEGSQYRVAPFVQDIFDEIVSIQRPDLAATIKEHTCMELV